MDCDDIRMIGTASFARDVVWSGKKDNWPISCEKPCEDCFLALRRWDTLLTEVD